ncbi:MAG: OmpW family outer membrane protein [Alphaproteobacteria bacterium]|nr:OmpW family outer membrane protein [Alphaproteobacteria bacterium]
MSLLKTSLASTAVLAIALAAAPAFAATHKAPAKPAVSPVDAVATNPIIEPNDGLPAFRPKQAGDFGIRLRGLGVFTDESGEITSAAGAPLGLNAEVSSEFVPEIDLTYFFTKNFAAELVLATTQHEVNAVAGATHVPVGTVWLLPPTLTVQYHPMPESRFSPYFGAGVNYTIFYGADAAGGTITESKYENSFGYAFQAGMDVALQGNWSLNFDVKKVFLDTNVKGNGTVGPWKSNVDLNPVLVGFGFGYRF